MIGALLSAPLGQLIYLEAACRSSLNTINLNKAVNTGYANSACATLARELASAAFVLSATAVSLHGHHSLCSAPTGPCARASSDVSTRP